MQVTLVLALAALAHGAAPQKPLAVIAAKAHTETAADMEEASSARLSLALGTESMEREEDREERMESRVESFHGGSRSFDQDQASSTDELALGEDAVEKEETKEDEMRQNVATFKSNHRARHHKAHLSYHSKKHHAKHHKARHARHQKKLAALKKLATLKKQLALGAQKVHTEAGASTEEANSAQLSLALGAESMEREEDREERMQSRVESFAGASRLFEQNQVSDADELALGEDAVEMEESKEDEMRHNVAAFKADDPKGPGIPEDAKGVACGECKKWAPHLGKNGNDECVCHVTDIMGTFANDATKTSTTADKFGSKTEQVGADRLPEGWTWHCRPVSSTGVWEMC